MQENIMAQIVLAYLGTRLVELLKRWSGVPWMTDTTEKVNRAVAALVALVATIGISVAGSWDGTAHTYTIVIGGLDVGNILGVLWGWFSQFVLQQMAYKGIVKQEAK